MWKKQFHAVSLFLATLATVVLHQTAAFTSVNPSFASKTSAPNSESKAKTTKFEPGQVLLPSTASDPTQFDTAGVVNPVVLPPCEANPKWQMYYYGNAGTWADGSKGFLPTGWCGLAESDDGIHWDKIVGPLDKGAILAPSQNPNDWDSLHVGVGDVIRISDQELHMYYFGGDRETMDNFGPSNESYPGIRMRIGRAKSMDNGRTWEKMGMVLDYDESEGLFASWPRILRPEDGNGDSNKPWQMLYHAFDGSKWRVFGATSADQGNTWKRRGLLLDVGTHKDSFDKNGVGTRAVTSPWRGGALMVYEGVDPKGKHRLGAAFCLDPDGAGEWTKLQRMLLKHEGGPVAEPGKGAMGAWTLSVIGTPYLISMPDGSLRMYHCGKAGDNGHSIGLVVSEHADVTPDFWKPVTL